jgi:glyoxylase I family protein
MRLRGVHHVTAICRDLDRTIGLYRDVLGMGIVHDGPSDDDPDARHVWFATADGSLVSFMQYPQLPEGVVGAGSTHHFALRVDSLEELEAWREYLQSRGIATTDVLSRAAFHSLYLRDPDGNVVELATPGTAFGAGGPLA